MDCGKWLSMATVGLLLTGCAGAGFGVPDRETSTGRPSPPIIRSGGTTPVNPMEEAAMRETEGVRGRVVALGGAPVAGAGVARRPIDPRRPINLQAAATDVDGRYTWTLAPGVWEIEISAAGYLPARQLVSVTEGRWETLSFILQPG
jgi:hypothetical protein